MFKRSRFRDREARVLSDLVGQGDVVVSTGAGGLKSRTAVSARLGQGVLGPVGISLVVFMAKNCLSSLWQNSMSATTHCGAA